MKEVGADIKLYKKSILFYKSSLSSDLYLFFVFQELAYLFFFLNVMELHIFFLIIIFKFIFIFWLC